MVVQSSQEGNMDVSMLQLCWLEFAIEHIYYLSVVEPPGPSEPGKRPRDTPCPRLLSCQQLTESHVWPCSCSGTYQMGACSTQVRSDASLAQGN